VLQNVDLLHNDGAVVESILRRSERQKDLNKDFKKSACSIKGCLGCSMDPQLFPFVIRNLGNSFCKIDPALLSDDALGQKQLKKKKTAPSPSGKKLNKKKPDGDDDDNVNQYGKKLK